MLGVGHFKHAWRHFIDRTHKTQCIVPISYSFHSRKHFIVNQSIVVVLLLLLYLLGRASSFADRESLVLPHCLRFSTAYGDHLRAQPAISTQVRWSIHPARFPARLEEYDGTSWRKPLTHAMPNPNRGMSGQKTVGHFASIVF